MFYIYAGFIVLRCLFLFSFGYVHPDEFFQGPEVLSKDIFNFETFLPWEYADSVHPCRSIIPVYVLLINNIISAVVVGIPFCVIKLMHAIFHGKRNSFMLRIFRGGELLLCIIYAQIFYVSIVIYFGFVQK